MTKISDLFQIRSRYLRSAHIERDFNTPGALENYVVTEEVQRCLNRISEGLSEHSGQRAWRITGDYGTGKSTFALMLAHILSGRESAFPTQLKRSIDLTAVKPAKRRLLPVLITGSREPIGLALIRALHKAVDQHIDKRARVRTMNEIEQVLDGKQAATDALVLDLLIRTNSDLIAKERTSGILVILDELGKFLEYAALHPDRQDIFLLQQLAEMSARSGKEPILTVGLLHQGFNAYSDQLSQASQREWEKVAGRFEELLFDQPLDQVTHLIGHSLDVKSQVTPKGWDSRSKTAMRAAAKLGWYGSAPPITSLQEIAPRIYPLHPTVVPVLVRLFSRFGQNERSLFSFLLSNEPHGLQTFSQREVSLENCYRIHHLYDYAAANFGHRLSVQSYRNHWNHIDSLVRSFPAQDETEVAVLKTVGLLNLLNSPELAPTEEALALAVGDGTELDSVRICDVLTHLRQVKHVLHSRGKRGGYCLWSHTSVNLDAAYDEASRALGNNRRVTELIKDRLDTRPIVARRHYIQTGNLRHFSIQYCTVSELREVADYKDPTSDGRILIPLCETAEDVALATDIAKDLRNTEEVLIGITEPLNSLQGLILEVERWNYVEKQTPELKDDRYAAEEVSRQKASALQALERRLQHYVGLRESANASGEMPIRWFRCGDLCKVASVSQFLGLLSDICDSIYRYAPRVSNELINRRSLSSAAAAARMRLIERMLESADQPYLGMDPAKKPPEMSIYLSVLQQCLLHREENGRWRISEPNETTDPGSLLPALGRIVAILESNPDGRFTAEYIFDELRRPPFGVRDGLLPLLLAVVLIQHQQEIALYENGTFKTQVSAPDFLRLTKLPKNFELQLCRIEGVRLAVFEKLAGVLNLAPAKVRQTELLDIVRPLCVFVAELPQYSRTTKRLSPHASAVRAAILDARDPAQLIFKNIPEACDFAPFTHIEEGRREVQRSRDFVAELQRCLDEIKMAFPALQDRMRAEINKAFELGEGSASFRKTRDILSQRSEVLLVNVTDLELKAFVMRLFDNALAEGEWLESMGSLLASVPPSRWKDQDETVFIERLQLLVGRFNRAESLNFSSNGKNPSSDAVAVRLSVTQKAGDEKDRVIYLSRSEDENASRIADELRLFLGTNKRVALSALSKLAWQLMRDENE